MDDEAFELSEQGEVMAIEIHDLFKKSTLNLEQIAFIMGLDSPVDVQVLYTLAVETGVIDRYETDTM